MSPSPRPWYRNPSLRVGVLTLAGLLLAGTSHGAIINVGVGTGCEAATLEEAIGLADDTPAHDEIRLLVGTQYEVASTIHLTDWNPSSKGTLTIAGGFQSCTDTTGDGPGPTIVNLGSGPVVEVDTTGANTSTVTLRNVQLALSGVRGLVAEGNSTVHLEDAEVSLNPGGGIAVSSGARVTIDESTPVHNNGPNSLGGGIRCTDAGSLVELAGVVFENEATVGGGVAVEAGCELLLEPSASILENDAVVGGGLDANTGALVSALEGGVSISRNEATSSGGGISVNGSGTQVFLAGVEIKGNRAGFWGAGIYANGSAFLALSAHDARCPNYFICQTCQGYSGCPGILFDNVLTGSAENGAAAVAINGAEVRLSRTLITFNEIEPTSTEGSVLYAEAGDAIIRTESVQISEHVGFRSVFHGRDGGDLRIAMTTVTGNFENLAGGNLSEGVRVEGAGSNASIYTSIFHPVESYVASGGGTFDAVDCLLTSTSSGLPGNATFVTLADPLFQDPDAENYHLRRGSPAIDYCDDGLFAPTVAGLDGIPRGIDDPHDPNGSPGVGGPFAVQDLGAFELGLVFVDGFESGDTSAW